MSTSDSLQNNLRRKNSLIIVTDVNMKLKRAFLQKVTVLLNSTTEKRGFTLINQLFLVFFCHNDHHGYCLAQTKIENIDVRLGRAFFKICQNCL